MPETVIYDNTDFLPGLAGFDIRQSDLSSFLASTHAKFTAAQQRRHAVCRYLVFI